MARHLAKTDAPRRRKASGVRPVERAEVTRIDAPAARRAGDDEVTLRRSSPPAPFSSAAPPSTSGDEPTLRRSLPPVVAPVAAETVPGRLHVEGPALPFEPAPAHDDHGAVAGEASPWAQDAPLDRADLPSSYMPPPGAADLERRAEEEASRRHARRVASVVWIAVGLLAAATLLAIWLG